MSAADISKAQMLTREMIKPVDILAALKDGDSYGTQAAIA